MRTLYVIGESHSDGLIGAFVRDPARNVLAVTHVTHIPALAPGEFLDADGRLHPKLVVALAGARFLHYAAPDHPAAVPAEVMGPNLFSPPWAPRWRCSAGLEHAPLLFVCGEIAARTTAAAIPPGADVETDHPPAALALVPPLAAGARVSAASAREVLSAQFAPMFAALRSLQGLGFARLGLHSIAPCTTDDERYREQCGNDTRARVRIKVILLANDLLRAFCRETGILYVDRWAEVTDGGAPRPGVLADAVHLRPEVMRRSGALFYEAVLAAEA